MSHCKGLPMYCSRQLPSANAILLRLFTGHKIHLTLQLNMKTRQTGMRCQNHVIEYVNNATCITAASCVQDKPSSAC